MAYVGRVQFYFTRSSRRHKIGRAHALAALADAGSPTVTENGDLIWIGLDDRGLELEIVAFQDADDPDLVVVKHVMPAIFRRRNR